MHKFLLFFIPHPKNNHQPFLTRHPALATWLVFTLTIQTALNILTSTSPEVLGFATNIYQQELIDQTNKYRIDNHLTSLKHSNTLDEAARLKAIHMFEKDYWAHVSPDGIDPWHWFQVVGYEYETAGENLARDFDTSSGVVSAWMASPSHRENILYSQFTEIGMAVVNGNLLGEETTLVVQLFGRPLNQPISSTTASTIQPTTAPTVKSGTPTKQPSPIITNIPSSPTTTVIPTATASFTPSPTLSNTNIVLGPIQQTNPPANNLEVAITVLKGINNFSINRIFVMSSLLILTIVLAVESFVYRLRNIQRRNAHRFIHVGILIISFIGVAIGASGSII